MEVTNLFDTSDLNIRERVDNFDFFLHVLGGIVGFGAGYGAGFSIGEAVILGILGVFVAEVLTTMAKVFT